MAGLLSPSRCCSTFPPAAHSPTASRKLLTLQDSSWQQGQPLTESLPLLLNLLLLMLNKRLRSTTWPMTETLQYFKRICNADSPENWDSILGCLSELLCDPGSSRFGRCNYEMYHLTRLKLFLAAQCRIPEMVRSRIDAFPMWTRKYYQTFLVTKMSPKETILC